jgi:hypothetical protein
MATFYLLYRIQIAPLYIIIRPLLTTSFIYKTTKLSPGMPRAFPVLLLLSAKGTAKYLKTAFAVPLSHPLSPHTKLAISRHTVLRNRNLV